MNLIEALALVFGTVVLAICISNLTSEVYGFAFIGAILMTYAVISVTLRYLSSTGGSSNLNKDRGR